MDRDELPRHPRDDPEGNDGVRPRNEFVVTPRKVGISAIIPDREMLHALNAQEHIDAITRDMVININRRLYERRLTPKSTSGTGQIEIEMPLTWWDHFKQTYQARWWLAWFVRRRPIATKVHTFAHRVDVSLEQYWKFPYLMPESDNPKLIAIEDYDIHTKVYRVQPAGDDDARS